MKIAYRRGYRYQLAEDFSIEIPILLPEDISTRFIKLDRHGLLTGRKDYAFDGASGLAADTVSVLRAAAIHDMGYQLLRLGLLEPKYRGVFDLIFKNVMLEDGVFPPRADLFYRGVSMFGEPSADPANEHPVLYAP